MARIQRRRRRIARDGAYRSRARRGGAFAPGRLSRYLPWIDLESTELVPSPIDLDRLVLIVTGAHLRAESTDRPLAYALRRAMLEWRRAAGAETSFHVLVCSDVWHLNNQELHTRPAVSIGGPGVNALSAYLIDKIPTAFVIDDRCAVHLDLDFEDLRTVCWGEEHGHTAKALDAFIDRYLDAFLRQAVRRCGGG